MYCPGCGTESPADQQFCRSCGLSLGQVLQALADPKESPTLKRLVEAKRATRIVARVFLAIALLFGGVLSNLDQVPPVGRSVFIGLAAVFALMAVGILSYWAGFSRRERVGADLRAQALGAGVTTRALPSAPMAQPVNSVTEGTTALIESDSPHNLPHEPRRESGA